MVRHSAIAGRVAMAACFMVFIVTIPTVSAGHIENGNQLQFVFIDEAESRYVVSKSSGESRDLRQLVDVNGDGHVDRAEREEYEAVLRQEFEHYIRDRPSQASLDGQPASQTVVSSFRVIHLEGPVEDDTPMHNEIKTKITFPIAEQKKEHVYRVLLEERQSDFPVTFTAPPGYVIGTYAGVADPVVAAGERSLSGKMTGETIRIHFVQDGGSTWDIPINNLALIATAALLLGALWCRRKAI